MPLNIKANRGDIMTVESGFEIICVKCGSGDVWFDTGGSGFDAELVCRNCGNDYWENYGV